jgi:hypothetical protein
MYLYRLLMAIFALGLLGTAMELLLLEHFEDALQFIPLVLIGLGLGVATWYWRSRSAASSKAFRGTIALFALAGLVGVFLHYRGNVEFEKERAPELSGLRLVWEALRGATPALAPGSMILLAAIGYAAMKARPSSQ